MWQVRSGKREIETTKDTDNPHAGTPGPQKRCGYTTKGTACPRESGGRPRRLDGEKVQVPRTTQDASRPANHQPPMNADGRCHSRAEPAPDLIGGQAGVHSSLSPQSSQRATEARRSTQVADSGRVCSARRSFEVRNHEGHEGHEAKRTSSRGDAGTAGQTQRGPVLSLTQMDTDSTPAGNHQSDEMSSLCPLCLGGAFVVSRKAFLRGLVTIRGKRGVQVRIAFEPRRLCGSA